MVSEKKCKHNYGWCNVGNGCVYIFPDGRISFDFNNQGKIKFRCNIPDCNAERNIYIKGEIVKFGKIHYVKQKTGGKK